MNTVSVLGGGAWGTAVATLLAENGYQVKLWFHEPDVARVVERTRINERFLAGVILNSRIQAVTDLQEALCGSHWIFPAIPVKYLRSVLQAARAWYASEQVWVILSKGIEQRTLMLPSQVLDDVFGCDVKKAVFSGPSFALDLARKQITAVTIAAPDCATGLQLQSLLANHYFRPYVSRDMIGVQLGGAIKNVITLGIGILDGAGCADNAKAFLLTRGLHEMVTIAHALGGRQETVYGLSGVGDLVLTAMGNLSKNLSLGKRLGQGQKLEQIMNGSDIMPEGINTVQAVYELIEQKKLELPICQGIYQMIFSGKTVAVFLAELMARPLEDECKV